MCIKRPTGCRKSAFGYAVAVTHVNRIIWTHTEDPKNPDIDGVIRRTDRIPDTIPGISRFQQSVVHQRRIEEHFLKFIEETSGSVTIRRPARPTNLVIDEALVDVEDAYPITVQIETAPRKPDKAE